MDQPQGPTSCIHLFISEPWCSVVFIPHGRSHWLGENSCLGQTALSAHCSRSYRLSLPRRSTTPEWSPRLCTSVLFSWYPLLLPGPHSPPLESIIFPWPLSPVILLNYSQTFFGIPLSTGHGAAHFLTGPGCVPAASSSHCPV
jgi:hypothetical protein